ncbi:hypothetical protein [Emticicia sp. C21]|uniref:hypothetical protein n=1 Tax=Emticicia sp. C21 TaxID=2302915 RepID=UPI000E348C18|nr:hypothetical protein [Emticicia sp. C21]RFS13991.1 hypothetical protein D0T08_23695 [Emticicia sp. C21]
MNHQEEIEQTLWHKGVKKILIIEGIDRAFEIIKNNILEKKTEVEIFRVSKKKDLMIAVEILDYTIVFFRMIGRKIRFSPLKLMQKIVIIKPNVRIMVF